MTGDFEVGASQWLDPHIRHQIREAEVRLFGRGVEFQQLSLQSYLLIMNFPVQCLKN